MWLCSDEVEEKPRLHTLHLKGLLELRMLIKKKTVTNPTQKRKLIKSKAISMRESPVCLQMDL